MGPQLLSGWGAGWEWKAESQTESLSLAGGAGDAEELWGLS